MLFYLRKLWSYVSLFFSRGVLSDKDIKKLLGYHIFIYPFKKENLKPSSYNLTASKCAFIKDDKGNQKLIIKDNKIMIPRGKTAIIETQESIYVSKWITGTYHSKVKLVNKGLGHIGTTLDPCFFGVSAIALHNNSDNDIPIEIGDTIATIMFYSLKSKSTGLHDNMSGRVDDNIKLGVEDFYQFNDDKKTVSILIKKKIDEATVIDNKFIQDNIKVIEQVKDKKIEDESIIIYDIDEPVCKKCNNCDEANECSFKLLKNINSENNKRDKIVKEIKEWKSQPWITSKESLIKVVKDYVKIESNNKDIFIYSLLWLVMGVITIIILSYFAIKYEGTKEILKIIIGAIIPTIAIIIGMIVKHKTIKGD